MAFTPAKTALFRPETMKHPPNRRWCEVVRLTLEPLTRPGFDDVVIARKGTAARRRAKGRQRLSA